MIVCKTCKDSGYSGDFYPCPDCELGWEIAEAMQKEQYEREMAELEMKEIEEHFRKYPHG